MTKEEIKNVNINKLEPETTSLTPVLALKRGEVASFNEPRESFIQCLT